MNILLGRAILLGSLLASLVSSPGALAQSYPSRTVTIVVTSAAGARGAARGGAGGRVRLRGGGAGPATSVADLGARATRRPAPPPYAAAGLPPPLHDAALPLARRPAINKLGVH